MTANLTMYSLQINNHIYLLLYIKGGVPQEKCDLVSKFRALSDVKNIVFEIIF